MTPASAFDHARCRPRAPPMDYRDTPLTPVRGVNVGRRSRVNFARRLTIKAWDQTSSRPGKPTDNAFVGSFNARFRDECLNTHWLLSLGDARAKPEAWIRDFNETRPHTSLGFMTPAEFASSAGVNPGR